MLYMKAGLVCGLSLAICRLQAFVYALGRGQGCVCLSRLRLLSVMIALSWQMKKFSVSCEGWFPGRGRINVMDDSHADAEGQGGGDNKE